jgi:hypothetical protein
MKRSTNTSYAPLDFQSGTPNDAVDTPNDSFCGAKQSTMTCDICLSREAQVVVLRVR